MKEDSKSEKSTSKPKPKQELDTPGKLMVAGIPKKESYKESELEKVFAVYGRITEVNIIRDKRTNIPRGFAFVTYENPQDSEDAIKAMEGKDLGGESTIHCEQAVLSNKRNRALNDRAGGTRGRGSRGYDRGRGRGVERSRGRGGDRRGIRGGMYRGRGRFEAPGRMFLEDQDEYFEEYYDQDPVYEFSFRGGRGIAQLGGFARGRLSQGSSMRGGRRVLLPDPPARGAGSYYNSFGGPQEEEYFDDGGDYYSGPGDSYVEGYEDQYPQEDEYLADNYYDVEQPVEPRGVSRQGMSSREGYSARGRPSRHQAEEYEDGGAQQRSRAPPRPLMSRPAAPQMYNEDVYDEDVETDGSVDRRRNRPMLQNSATGSSIRPGRANPGTRGGPRRAALLESEPYAQESDVYNRPRPQRGAALQDYEDDQYADPYGGRSAPSTSRQVVGVRSRPALLPLEDAYLGRSQPKPLLGGESRRPAAGNQSRYVDDYEDSGLTQGADSRRQVGRRNDPDYRMREDQYQEPDDFASYPTNPRGPAQLISSDQYRRKRRIDPYNDAPEVGVRANMSSLRGFDDFGQEAPIPAKRDRIERPPNRGGYKNYSSRPDNSYREF